MGTWAKTLRILVVALALAALAGGAAPAAASQGGETQCIGAPASMVVQGDLVVPTGQSCELLRTVVTGDVRVEAGAELRTDSAEIIGNVRVGELANARFLLTRVLGTVYADSSLNLDAFGGMFGGDVRADDTQSLFLFGTTFGGDLQVNGYFKSPWLSAFELHVKGNLVTTDTRFSHLFDSRVDGDVTIAWAQQSSVLCRTSVGGDAMFSGNATLLAIGGGPFPCGGNEVRGTLAVYQNQAAITIADNITGGDLAVYENQGATTVTNNSVRGDLDCTENQPVPTGGNNQVKGAKLGQCSGL